MNFNLGSVEDKRKIIIKYLLLSGVVLVGGVCIGLTSKDINDICGKSCCLLLLIFLLSRGKDEGFLLNPVFMFCILPITLIIYYPDVSSRYLSNLNTKVWVIAIWNMLALAMGYLFTKAYQGRVWRLGGFKCHIYDAIDGKERLKKYFWLSLAIGMLPTIYSLIVGMPYIFKGDIYSLRNFFYAFPAASVIKFLQYFAISCAFKLREKKYIAIAIIAQVLTIFTVFDKLGIMFLAMTIVICWLKYYQATIDYVKLCLFGLIVIVVMLWGFSFYESIRSTENISTIDKLINRGDLIWNAPKVLAMPYMYMVQGWNNLQYVMETQASQSWGAWLLNPILHYLPIEIDMGQKLEASSFFNTFTYIGVLFKDYGIVGSGFVSALLGWWIKKVYTMFLRSDSPFSVCIYAINLVAVFQMFFSNHFLMQIYPFYLCVLLLLYQVCMGKLYYKK